MPQFLEAVQPHGSAGAGQRRSGIRFRFWVSRVGPLSQFVHQWGYDSMADYEARCAKRDAHPDLPGPTLSALPRR